MSIAEDKKETMARHPFIARFIEHGNARSTDGIPQWWSEFRTQALRRLVSLDVPTRKDEEWKFINLAGLTGGEYVSETDVSLNLDDDTVEERRLPESSAATLVFANGRYEPGLSNVDDLADGVRVTTWSELREAGETAILRDHIDIAEFWEEDLFYNLNGANFEDGAVIMVPRNQVLETPIHILYVAGGSQDADHAMATHPRNVIVTGESAEVTVIEEYASFDGGCYFHNVVDEISLGANSKVRHVKVQRDSKEAYHVARNIVTLSQDSNYDSTTVNLGAALSRSDAYARFDGKNIECTLDGLGFISGKQVTDTHTAMDHALPDSTSYQLQKNIVADRAHSVFNGKIFVRQDAQRIDSNQLNQNLLLSPRAHVDTKPQLEILADDVVCSHGATVGQLQDDQLFYLMTRGMDEEQARSLLTYAFAAEVLEDIEVDSLRNRLESLLMERTR